MEEALQATDMDVEELDKDTEDMDVICVDMESVDIADKAVVDVVVTRIWPRSKNY